MTLFKRGGVYWSYVYVDGVRHARSTQTGNRKLADRIDDKHKEELRLKGSQFPELKPKMPFAELAAKFLATGTAKAWHVDRLKVLLPYFAELEIAAITKGTIRQFRKYRHDAKRLTETTVNRDVEALRHLLYFAVDEGLLQANPIARIRLERVRRKKQPVLSIGEELLLLPASAEHLREIIVVALDTGMRRGEILHQQWQDVDFNRRILFVSRSKTPEGEAREIPLSDRVFALLSERRRTDGLIFLFEGRPIHSLKTAWKAAIRRSGIRYVRFHYLRHTFATRLLELGVLREVRMAILGHTFHDTHESYCHVELTMKREAIQKLAGWHASATETALAKLLDEKQKTECESKDDAIAQLQASQDSGRSSTPTAVSTPEKGETNE